MTESAWRALLLTGALLAGLSGLCLWYLRRVWFHRDPVRSAPQQSGVIVSACDGIVVYVRPYTASKITAQKGETPIDLPEITMAGLPAAADGWLIGVYMSPLDVHFNYAPVSGVVERVVHTPAALNLPMVDLWEYIKLTYLRRAVDLFAARYRLVNERNTIFIRGTTGGRKIDVTVVEIADKFVNKITCFVKPGDSLTVGQKLSFIARGSQVDLILPSEGLELQVTPGQRVTGGLTPVARVVPQAGLSP